jgi:hypothetical protein
MLKLYARLAGLAARRALRGWPIAIALLLYAVLLQIARAALEPSGMLGGFLVGFAMAFLASSYLHLLSLAVAGRPIRPADFRDSFGARFWDVVSVLFALWVIELGFGVVTANAGSRGEIVMVLVGLTMAVFFNPVPELIYLGEGRLRSFGLLLESARFISARWPEWLGPNILLAGVVLAPTGFLHRGPVAMHLLTMQQLFSLDGLVRTVTVIPLWLAPIMLMFITWAMVFRGLLFLELASKNVRRPRKWPP